LAEPRWSNAAPALAAPLRFRGTHDLVRLRRVPAPLLAGHSLRPTFRAARCGLLFFYFRLATDHATPEERKVSIEHDVRRITPHMRRCARRGYAPITDHAYIAIYIAPLSAFQSGLGAELSPTSTRSFLSACAASLRKHCAKLSRCAALARQFSGRCGTRGVVRTAAARRSANCPALSIAGKPPSCGSGTATIGLPRFRSRIFRRH
jgi:hypothetical protein